MHPPFIPVTSRTPSGRSLSHGCRCQPGVVGRAPGPCGSSSTRCSPSYARLRLALSPTQVAVLALTFRTPFPTVEAILEETASVARGGGALYRPCHAL